MSARIYEIPKRLAELLRRSAPIHEETREDYCYAIRLALGDDNAPSGFIVEQRLSERSAPAAEGQGMSFKVPAQPSRSEATFVFVESLTEALNYIRRQAPGAAPGSG